VVLGFSKSNFLKKIQRTGIEGSMILEYFEEVKPAILKKFKELHHTEKHHCKKAGNPTLCEYYVLLSGVLHVPLV